MIDLILAYFKSIALYFDELYLTLAKEVMSIAGELDTRGIESFIRNQLASVAANNLMIKIFSLKDIKECALEANV